MFSIVWLSFGVLACLSLSDALEYCGTYGGNGEYCYPDDYQAAYCCGYNDNRCCYYTDASALWWVWFLIILLILFFAIIIAIRCRRRRQQQRHGYVVVGGQTYFPGSVVTRNDAQIAQVAPPGTVYGGPPYQGYQDPNLGGQNVYGYPPPYAPPTAPPNAPHK